MNLIDTWQYWVTTILFFGGLYITISSNNLIKKLAGLSIFQTAVIIFYVSLAKIKGGTAPILMEHSKHIIYDNPLPHVLMLTAIVVGIATTAVGLALVIRIHRVYDSIEEDDVRNQIRTTSIESLPIKEDIEESSFN